MFGIPYENVLSRNVKARMAYIETNYGIPEQDYIKFDAMR